MTVQIYQSTRFRDQGHYPNGFGQNRIFVSLVTKRKLYTKFRCDPFAVFVNS